MILTHGANSLARGGGGVTPPEGYELIQGIYGSYNADIWFNGYNPPPALSGKTNSDVEMEVELFIRNTVSPNYESQIFATSNNAGRIYIKGNNDGTGFRIGALSGNSSYTPTYIETDISVTSGTKLTITLSQNTLIVKYGTSVLTSSSIPYTNVSINDTILLFYPNTDTKPYAVSHAVIRDKTSGQNLVDIYPLKKMSDGSCYCWDVVGNVFKGGNLYEYKTVEIGGRKYPVVKIGNQLWMAENLDYAYQGLAVNAVGSPTTPGAWYNGDSYRETYGLLYNHYAVDYINSHLSEIGIPSGWHVPTKAEYETLFSSVGGINNTPSVLRDTSWGGSDQYGFCAKPGGYYFNGSYSTIGTYAWFWTATMDGAASFKYLLGQDAYLEPDDVRDAFSLRLVKDIT